MSLIIGIVFVIMVALGNIVQSEQKVPDNLPKNPPVIQVDCEGNSSNAQSK